MIALASGKGGTGKSFLASNLAVAMYDRGLRVTLVDCDFGLGNDHLLLGVNPRLSVQHFLGGMATIEEVRVRTPYGPWLLPGGSGLGNYLGNNQAQWAEYDASDLARNIGEARPTNPILIDQGLADQFLEQELNPHLLEAACAEGGIDLQMRRHAGYDHGYYFIATFMEDHLRHHAKHLLD